MQYASPKSRVSHNTINTLEPTLFPLELLDSLPLLAMDLGAVRPRSESASEESENKRRAKGQAKGQASGSMDEVVKQIAKLSLSNAQSTRALESCVMETFKLPADNPYYKAYKEGTVLFA